jgi:hypothetical protein
MPGYSSSNRATSSFKAGIVEETKLCQKVIVISSSNVSLSVDFSQDKVRKKTKIEISIKEVFNIISHAR